MPFEPVPADPPADYPDAVWAACLLAIDPAGLGGIQLRARYGDRRDAFLQQLAALLPTGTPWRKMPAGISADRLFGGLDLTATLAAGRPVPLPGLLAQAAGGVLVMAMAERISPATAARIAAAIDQSADVAVLALDEGLDDEAAPAALQDRLAFTVAEASLPPTTAWPAAWQIAPARRHLPDIATGRDALERICRCAAALAIASPRACLFALRAARAAAAFAGHAEITEDDTNLAIRLVLLPRAQAMPTAEDQAEDQAEQPDAAEPAPQPDPAEQPDQQSTDTPPEDITADAARALLPAALLQSLKSGQIPRRPAAGGGKSGNAASLARGRPAGVRPGHLGHGARLSVIETLRAAIPWQRLRRPRPGSTTGSSANRTAGRIAIRPEDFRIQRLRQRPQHIAIFAVDASGSAALNRLAEAKGAVQLLLADCYIRRDQVALLAFRGRTAETLLPPTGALARARRSLASLPGGGPTPLATGIDAARSLAEAQRRKSMQPLIVLLTDGGANIGRNGAPGRAAAGQDALAAARACRAGNFAALVVDTAPRPQDFVASLAREMGARYLALPYADSAALTRAVQQQEPARGQFAA